MKKIQQQKLQNKIPIDKSYHTRHKINQKPRFLIDEKHHFKKHYHYWLLAYEVRKANAIVLKERKAVKELFRRKKCLDKAYSDWKGKKIAKVKKDQKG